MYHWTSSQAFELALRKWRLNALPLLIRQAISTSQVATVPKVSLTASMTRLARSNLFTSIPLGHPLTQTHRGVPMLSQSLWPKGPPAPMASGRQCSLEGRLSAAGDAHMARQRGPLVAPIDNEIVPFGLASDCFVDRCIQQVVAFRGTQRPAQIGRVLLAQTHVKRPGAGHPHAITRFAEIVGEGSDKAKASACFGNADEAGRPTGLVIDVIKRVALSKPSARDRQRQILIEPTFADVAERHDLNEREVHAAPMRPLHQVGEFILVDALERDGIDLD